MVMVFFRLLLVAKFENNELSIHSDGGHFQLYETSSAQVQLTPHALVKVGMQCTQIYDNSNVRRR